MESIQGTDEERAASLVNEYYEILRRQPDRAREFYNLPSKMIRFDHGHKTTEVETLLEIHSVIMSLGFTGVEIKTVKLMGKLDGGYVVVVKGSVESREFLGKRMFRQSLFFAPQGSKYYIHHDIFLFDGEEPGQRVPTAAPAQQISVAATQPSSRSGELSASVTATQPSSASGELSASVAVNEPASISSLPQQAAAAGDSLAEDDAKLRTIRIRELTMAVSPKDVEQRTRKFGRIKAVWLQDGDKSGFTGFVEFEDPSSVEKAVKGSPIFLRGRSYNAEKLGDDPDPDPARTPLEGSSTSSISGSATASPIPDQGDSSRGGFQGRVFSRGKGRGT